MTTFLLIIIYFAFISLGLPDAMLGSAWPVMQGELGLPLSGAGLVSMIVSGGTIVSSLLSGKLIRRFGTARLTTISVLMTALALLGFSFTRGYGWMLLMAVPLGLGAGAVDTTLNDFVARNYAARHMNWLHSFWGIGATLSPIIMALALARTGVWQNGYRWVAVIQFALVGVLVLSLPVWRRFSESDSAAAASSISTTPLSSIPGLGATLAGFFAYCALETTTGLWGASYLVGVRGIAEEVAAGWVASYYLGITIGRMVNGFASIKFSSKQLIRMGIGSIFVGVLLLIILKADLASLAGLMLIGLGCGPIFPTLLHETPYRFGAENSGRLMGIQMATAYVGTTLGPPLIGLLLGKVGLWVYPLALLLLAMILLAGTEQVNRVLKTSLGGERKRIFVNPDE